ncbi:MAG TPA: choice-of-anchor Q domain-containing protein [Candidatus Paceibacterota bacterium]|nr:choice-of-anchor Q domain-containing protein [Verrucomicrobiota bacterium]HSA11772.1 choice-of-anchor Q domain-containing protein [Candidatus Paceibacterota bacterium]
MKIPPRPCCCCRIASATRKQALEPKLNSLVLAVACLTLLCSAPIGLRAATIAVTSTADSGPGTLRNALAGAANGDTIDVTGLSGTITLTSGQLTVSNSVTLLGPGAGTLTVSGNHASRVFDVTGTNVTIRGLAIANGQGAVDGAGLRTGGPVGSIVTLSDCVVTNNTTSLGSAGIFNSAGVTLTLSNCTIAGNSAPSGNAGGIYNGNGTVTLTACTVSGNFAYYVGGGIFNDGAAGGATLTITASTISSNSAYSGGGVLNYGQSGSAMLTISASTLSGNSAYSYGGGAIYNNGWSGNGTVRINASTISSNSAAYGGAIFNDVSGGVALVQMGDTILAAGSRGANVSNSGGTITSAGYNLSSDNAAGFLTGPGDRTNTDPLLGPLQDNGGPTWTHALLTNSPAIDQGKSNAITNLARATDQRGLSNISDFPAVTNAAGGDGSDIGALEVQNTPVPSIPAAAYTFSTLAGRSWWGSADGVGDQAQFSYPSGITADSAGNLYVTDSGNSTIRKITPAGVVSTIAGLAGMLGGSADGIGSNARFSGPSSIAADSAGNLFVADTGNSTIRKVTPTGVVSTVAGLAGDAGTNDGIGGNARFYNPRGITVDSTGNLFVADCNNHTIRKITPVGTNWVVSTLAGQAGQEGSNDGTNSNAGFHSPHGITVDGAGNLYVADMNNGTIRKVTPAGTNWVVSTIAGQVYSCSGADGTNTDARFCNPEGITADSAGNLYVADSRNDTIRKITPEGTNWVVSTLAGLAQTEGSANGTGSDARFDSPSALTVDSAGNLFVADTENHTIRTVTSAGVVTTLAGSAVGHESGSDDGTGSNARFYFPAGIAVNSAGNLFVTDSANNTIRTITSAGVVNTLAGSAGTNGSADGAGGHARFDRPGGISLDGAGNLFVADTANHTVRKVTSAGMVSTIAGVAGTNGTADGTGSNARFDTPWGIARDLAGNCYVADSANFTIRKLSPVGTNWAVSTIAGLAGAEGTADGTGSDARFGGAYGITVDNAGKVYVVDTGNKTIRKLSPIGTNWVVNTLAGQPGMWGTNDGPGSSAQFAQPIGIAVDGAGNLFVSDYWTIRKITPVGTNWVVSTIGGLPYNYGSTDGTGQDARFYYPMGIAVDDAGNLYLADGFNNLIRKALFTSYGAANAMAFTPPPMSGQLVVKLLPAEAKGQWRFGWDQFWRNTGDVVSNLVPGNYPVVFRDVPGYLAYPPTTSVAVLPNATSYLTNQYLPTFAPDVGGTGSLMVGIGPNRPPGAGWRFIGETAWRAAYTNVSGLLPDTYYVEFAPVSGWSRPLSLAAQVSGGQQSVVTANYTFAQTPPSGVMLPHPVPATNINDLATCPFGYNGQLLTDMGYGSGVAVDANVVLTAAHLVFNDFALAYAEHAYWFFQRQAGVFEPEPMAARGWYMLSGYASQRTNDLLGGLSPEQSSPQSRNLDVAALYFPSPVAGGGYGGYLPSDAEPNIWLTGTTLKMLVGYPVDGSQLGDASIVPGQMYQTEPQPYPLTLATDPVPGQQVYVAPWFLSYPGNSGGPLYVQMNGYYYPAGVYLGTLYNGTQPYASLVRAIDSAVVNLITNAAMLGDAGTNYTGGGVITITVGGGSGSLAYLQVNLGPPAAVAGGAAWRRQGTADWCGNSPFTVTVPQGGSAALEFKPVAGWNLPSAQAITLTLGQLTTASALYTQSTPVRLSDPRVLPDGALAMTLEGVLGCVYSITGSTNLLEPLTNWAEVLRLTNSTGQTAFTNPPPPATPFYYRAKQL